MSVSTLEKFDLLPFIEKIKSFPVTQLRKFDALLSDIANYVYDMAEAIGELPPQLSKLNKQQTDALLSKLAIIQSQSAEIVSILYNMDYDSHYMDRLIHTIRPMENDIKEIIKQLEKG